MKKKHLHGKLSLKIKDLSALSSNTQGQIKGGEIDTASCNVAICALVNPGTNVNTTIVNGTGVSCQADCNPSIAITCQFCTQPGDPRPEMFTVCISDTPDCRMTKAGLCP